MKREHGQSTAEMGLLAFLTAVLFFIGIQAVGQAIKVAFYATTPAYCDEYSRDENKVIWHVLDCRTGLSINPPVRIN